MNRDTAIGRMFRCDPEAARLELRHALERNHGNMMRTAHDLGIHRRHLYKLLYREGLKPVADILRNAHARELQQGPEWMRRAREALR